MVDKKNAMEVLINQGEDSIHETQNVLARIWRIVLVKYGVSFHQWHRSITKYQDKIIRISSKKGAANMKGNMTRRLVEDRLSWDTLLRGLAILEFDKIEITLRLTKRFETQEITIIVPNDEIVMDDEDHN